MPWTSITSMKSRNICKLLYAVETEINSDEMLHLGVKLINWTDFYLLPSTVTRAIEPALRVLLSRFQHTPQVEPLVSTLLELPCGCQPISLPDDDLTHKGTNCFYLNQCVALLTFTAFLLSFLDLLYFFFTFFTVYCSFLYIILELSCTFSSFR